MMTAPLVVADIFLFLGNGLPENLAKEEMIILLQSYPHQNGEE
jgi:hypothetical protein